MSLLEYAKSMYPNARIDGHTTEDHFGEIVWLTTPDKSTHIVSEIMMKHHIEMKKYRDAMV